MTYSDPVVRALAEAPDDDEPTVAEDIRPFREGQAWFAARIGEGIPIEGRQCGCSMAFFASRDRDLAMWKALQGDLAGTLPLNNNPRTPRHFDWTAMDCYNGLVLCKSAPISTQIPKCRSTGSSSSTSSI